MLSVIGGVSAMFCLYCVSLYPVVMSRIKCNIIVGIDQLRIRVKKQDFISDLSLCYNFID